MTLYHLHRSRLKCITFARNYFHYSHSKLCSLYKSRHKFNTILQQSSWILPITDFFQHVVIKTDDTEKSVFLKRSLSVINVDIKSQSNLACHPYL